MPFSLQATPAGVTSSGQSLELSKAPRPSHRGSGQVPEHCVPAAPDPGRGAVPEAPLNASQTGAHGAGRMKLNPAGTNADVPGVSAARSCRRTATRRPEGAQKEKPHQQRGERRGGARAKTRTSTPPLPVRWGAGRQESPAAVRSPQPALGRDWPAARPAPPRPPRL